MKPLDLTTIDTDEWDDWNARNDKAMDAYARERRASERTCLTCPATPTFNRRECEPCRRERYKATGLGRRAPRDWGPSIRDANHQDRVADLEHLADFGMGARKVAESLHITMDALQKWCKRHGQADLYARLRRAES